MVRFTAASVLSTLILAGQAAAAPPSRQNGDFHAVAPSVALPITTTVRASDPTVAALHILGDPNDLVVTQVRSSLAEEHVRFAQVASDGTRVAGAEVSVHMKVTGQGWRGRLVWSNVVRPLALHGSRALSSSKAGAAAAAAMGGGTPWGIEPVAIPGPGVGEARAGWKVIVIQDDPRHEWEVWVDGETGAWQVARDGAFHVDGTAYVYRPNPVTTTGDTALTDNANADSTALTAAREMVVLPGLDGSGMLRGDYADAENKTSRVTVASLNYDYTRSQIEFEEVMAYYTVDHTQRHLQALGYTGPKAILATPFHVIANAITADNSFYSATPSPQIQLGKGGVDDGEDGDVIAHEYGHAIQDNVIPGYGTVFEANALGEGFGDLDAFSAPTDSTVLVERECVAPWDATSYSSTSPPCLRRVDGHKHYPEHSDGEVHDDGEIFSGAVYDMYTASGLGTDGGYTLVLEALFSLTAGPTFADMAEGIVAADVSLNGGTHAAAIRRALLWHGMLATITPPDPFSGPIASMPISVESAHPISNLEDQQQIVTVPGATALRLHFASLDMEVDPSCVNNHCDNVYLYDGNGLLYAILGGNSGAFDAPAIPGDTVTVRWVSDGSVGSTGFVIDSVSYITTTTPTVDAAPGTPDANPAAPDADLTAPDADLTAPDADLTAPDAGAGGPDGGTNKGGDSSGCGCRTTSRGASGAARDAAGGGPAGAALLLLGLLVAPTAWRRARAGRRR